MKAKVTYIHLVEVEPVEIEISPETIKYVAWIGRHIGATRPTDSECQIAIGEIKDQVQELNPEAIIDISKVELIV